VEVGADRQWKTVAIFVRRLGFFLLWIASVAPAIGDTEPSGVPQGISALSYFIGTWSCQGDSFGGIRDFSSSGWKGNALVWTSDAQVRPLQQFAYTKTSDKSFRVAWQVFKNGGYIGGDTLTCARQPRPAEP